VPFELAEQDAAGLGGQRVFESAGPGLHDVGQENPPARAAGHGTRSGEGDQDHEDGANRGHGHTLERGVGHERSTVEGGEDGQRAAIPLEQ
jgi:hypothetical protein